MNFNRIVLIGTVQNKPETKHTTDSGLSVSKFVVSAARPPRQDGRLDYDKIPVVAFGKTADYAAENLQTNSTVLVEGRIQVSQREADGLKTYQTEVNAQTVRLFGGVSSPAPASTPAQSSAPPPETAGNPFGGSTEDDVPF
ncbi:single-stranded DNA-binding protein [Candidatus Termititenax dinenymphae]|uniref:Single-stranded DNA-binding protein n=1 Tax=Candidatus Termititenax dinenymphae TaxID=2218523 RepID=A0A388TK91_9BACT|nr:single-stranded DNA-binding protein [Candidatus Termititenax dinenymphae]